MLFENNFWTQPKCNDSGFVFFSMNSLESNIYKVVAHMIPIGGLHGH